MPMDDEAHAGDLESAVDDAISWAFITVVRLLRSQKAILLLRELGQPTLVGRTAVGLDLSTVRSTRIRMGEGVAGIAAQRRALLLGALGDERFICAPIVVEGRVEGVLEITGDPGAAEYGDEDLAAAALLARHIGHLLAQPGARPSVAADLPRLEQLEVMLERELARSKRAGLPFALALIDLGDLPGTLGTEESAVIIARAMEALRPVFRRYDYIGYRGRGELALILAAPSEPNNSVIGRIADAITRACQDIDNNLEMRVGLAHCPRDGISVDELLTTADARLKHNGRVRSAS